MMKTLNFHPLSTSGDASVRLLCAFLFCACFSPCLLMNDGLACAFAHTFPPVVSMEAESLHCVYYNNRHPVAYLDLNQGNVHSA